MLLRSERHGERRARLHSLGHRARRRRRGVRAAARAVQRPGVLCRGGGYQYGHGRDVGSLLRPPQPRAESGRRDGHQRQDYHGHAAIRSVHVAGLSVGSDIDRSLPHRQAKHRLDPHDARLDTSQRDDAPHGRRGVPLLLHGGVVALDRPAPHRRARLRRRHIQTLRTIISTTTRHSRSMSVPRRDFSTCCPPRHGR